MAVAVNSLADDVWPTGRSVLLTSLWGWSPETWGAVGWTGPRGLTRRNNLLRRLSDPFITVCYATANRKDIDRDLKGKIAGFYLVSHETGDRDSLSHPLHHHHEPEKWRHSNRAIRAFSYLPEYRLTARELAPDLLRRARTISAMGEILTDPEVINKLRETPWEEVPVYGGALSEKEIVHVTSVGGFTRPGPANRTGYWVESSAYDIPRRLYVLRLHGDEAAYLGPEAKGKWIVKVGLSASPELRRQAFHKAMPEGKFIWNVERTSGHAHFESALLGETAMKRHLAKVAKHLGSEFYLVAPDTLNEAWDVGLAAARVIAEGKS